MLLSFKGHSRGTSLHSRRAFRTSITLLAALLTCASAASATLTLEPGTDRLGSDYKGFALNQPDPELCRTACNADGACKAYSYVKPGVKAAQAMCYLKNAAPLASVDACCTSGTRKTGPLKIRIPPPGVPALPSLRTLAPGSAMMQKAPVYQTPAELTSQRRIELTKGKDGELFAQLAPNKLFEPERAWITLIGPNAIWGGSGNAVEPTLASFPTNSDDRPAELRLKLQPAAKKLLLVDCTLTSTHKDIVYVVSESSGPEQIFNPKQLFDGHLLFLVDSTGVSHVSISADEPWNFHNCQIRAL